jgi:NAD(P)H-dependent FMN reductase
MANPKIAIIVSSTRPTRFADVPTAWIKAQAEARGDMDVEVVDLRDFPMPFFAEVASNAWAPTQDPTAQKWQKKIAEFGAIAYGSMGGANALGHLQNIGVELQMVPTRNNVRVGGGDFFKVHPGFGGTGNLADIEASIAPSAKAMLDDVVWWANATKAARG